MYNFGFIDLRCVGPYERSFRAARSAIGASVALERAWVTETMAEAELVIASGGLDAESSDMSAGFCRLERMRFGSIFR